jgi:hypothetical protein
VSCRRDYYELVVELGRLNDSIGILLASQSRYGEMRMDFGALTAYWYTPSIQLNLSERAALNLVDLVK